MLQHLVHNTILRFIFYPVLMVLLQQHSLSTGVFADDNGPVNEPEIWLSTDVATEPETQMPEPKTKKSWFSRNKWWVALGTIVLGGAVAGLAASGGDDSDDNAKNVGDYNADW